MRGCLGNLPRSVSHVDGDAPQLVRDAPHNPGNHATHSETDSNQPESDPSAMRRGLAGRLHLSRLNGAEQFL